MSATGSTTNYKLPQFVENDIPSWLTDFNSAMEKIDAAIHNAADSSGEPSDYQQLKTSVSELTQKMETVVAVLKTLNNAVVVGTASGGITATQYSKLKVVPISTLD
jgi:hypothetical protein